MFIFSRIMLGNFYVVLSYLRLLMALSLCNSLPMSVDYM